MQFARAIFWAYGRSLVNFYPKRGMAGSAIVGLGWYGTWILAAFEFARVFRSPGDLAAVHAALPGGLLLMFLYWQVVPLLLATTGASLDLRKLRAYPAPENQLFWIEIVLRLTSSIEMVLLLAGMVLGTLFNPLVPKWSAAGALYCVFNVVLAVGLRDFLGRQLARKRIREIAALLLVLCIALPQIILARRGILGGPMRLLFLPDTWQGWPWSAAANLLMGVRFWSSLSLLAAWIAGVYAFSFWQFKRSLHFDSDAAGSGSSSATSGAGWRGLTGDWLYRWPSLLWSDPLGAMVEKDVRMLTRSSRFRLVYIMGLIFGSLLPLMFVRQGVETGFFYNNYLTLVCVYALMLMSEACFWNVFGFDRSAAQFYFLAPVSFARVLVSKNVTAAFFLATQMALVTVICMLLGMPLDIRRLTEAYSATAVVMLLLFSAGNLLSIHQPRGVNPAQSFRSGTAGRLQAMLFAVYPIAFLPLGLAYLARYALDSQAALYVVLALDAVLGLSLYKVALDSAVEAADRGKEGIMRALAAGEGPITD